ncbi:MAG: hypothetical protein M3Q51_06975, partial [Pseudomonadota bacterium]|nr:hypothetical protein [Pseudomonadota bacterium]
MTDTETKTFNLMTARWLALGAAAGAALLLALDRFGVYTGQLQGAALVMALLALFGSIAVNVAFNRRERGIDDLAERSFHGEAEVSALQQEINRHAMLEQELTVAKQAA